LTSCRVEQERERISRALVFGDSREVRQLERVQARLAKELEQSMAAYEKARALAASVPASGAPPQPYRVELHLVGRTSRAG
jgi:hypothetical protein